MSLVFIYHREERELAERFASPFADAGRDVVFAPLGWQVGSEPWIAQVESDIRAADCCFILWTHKSVTDRSVLYRVVTAHKARRRLIPIVVDRTLSPAQLPHFTTDYQFSRWPPNDQDPTVFARGVLKSLPASRRPVSCFLSYSRNDAEFVARLKADLQQNAISCWRDIDNIPAGASWDNEIEAALKDCSHVLFVVTPKSVESSNVADEIGFAREHRKPIIPLLVQDAPLPLRVHRAQAVDFTADYDSGLKALLASLIDSSNEISRGSDGFGNA